MITSDKETIGSRLLTFMILYLCQHQIKSFNLLFSKLNKGGIYIIEDIKNIDACKEAFLSLHPTAKIFDFRTIKNRSDDIIVEIKK